jgi:hypothetical protein
VTIINTTFKISGIIPTEALWKKIEEDQELEFWLETTPNIGSHTTWKGITYA